MTHYQLKTDPDKKGKPMVDPESRLEGLIIRSETIIWDYKNWIPGDLPLINQSHALNAAWVVSAHLRVSLAGGIAHATKEEAIAETEQMLHIYAEFMEQYMAIPGLEGNQDSQ